MINCGVHKRQCRPAQKKGIKIQFVVAAKEVKSQLSENSSFWLYYYVYMLILWDVFEGEKMCT